MKTLWSFAYGCSLALILVMIALLGCDSKPKEYTYADCITKKGCEMYFYGGMTAKEYERKAYQEFHKECAENPNNYGCDISEE